MSQRDQGHNISDSEWKLSLKRLSKIHCSSRTRWRNIQIFIRTVWTPMKQFHQTDILDDACCPGCADHWPANTAHMLYECSGLASNVWNFVRDLLGLVNNKPIRLTKMKALYFHQVTNLVDYAVIASAKRAILRAVHSVCYPIHPKVGIRFLLTEIVCTADTNVRALRDTPQWFRVKEEATQMWKDMKREHNYIVPSQPRR